MNDLDSRWPLSKALLQLILEYRINDSFVTGLVWERLGYLKPSAPDEIWIAGPTTPKAWSESFPFGPEVIAQRRASVALTRSIDKDFKQLLKEKMGFPGYRIGDLFPRKTRRATAVNWLLAWLTERGEELPENGPIPLLMEFPPDPQKGHPGDPPVF